MRCRSANFWSCSCVPPGMNSDEKSWRNAGLSSPHPVRIKVARALAFCSSNSFFARRYAPRAKPTYRMRCETRSGWRTAKATEMAQPCDIPRSGKRSSPAASTTVSRSLTHASSDRFSTSQSDSPLPRLGKLNRAPFLHRACAGLHAHPIRCVR